MNRGVDDGEQRKSVKPQLLLVVVSERQSDEDIWTCSAVVGFLLSRAKELTFVGIDALYTV